MQSHYLSSFVMFDWIYIWLEQVIICIIHSTSEHADNDFITEKKTHVSMKVDTYTEILKILFKTSGAETWLI